jgi:acyl-CoA synthetase (AMP-forming)/AMP-acid ligase II
VTDTAEGSSERWLPSLEGTRWAHLDVDRRILGVSATLDEAAERWGDRLLWHFPEQGVTASYAEARADMHRLAAGLHRLGVGVGSRVGVMLGNVPEFPQTWLALARLGAVSVPMNPRYTSREVEFIADDTEMSHLVVDSATWRALQEKEPTGALLEGCSVVVVDGPAGQGEIAFEEVLNVDVDVADALRKAPGPEALLTIQFTSGTTGLPKGCLLTHEYWVSLGRCFSALTGHPQRVLADYPFFYMQNQSYLMTAIASGGQIIVTHGLSLSRFLGWLHDFDIDMAWMSGALLRVPPSSADRAHHLRLAPADEIDVADHAELERRFGMRVREWYASTEAGMGTVVPWEDDDRVGSGSIGVEAPFRQTRVVDEQLRDVAPGETGELCLRGPGMMLGYHNRPEANAELFIEDGWFRTGDLCRKDADGYHFFVGRLKDMVRRSGENVSAQEVEDVLRQLPAVEDAAVIGVPDSGRGEEVMAFLVLATPPERRLTAAEVWDWCRTRLAPFKTPRYLRFVAALPRTASGKTAKAELKVLAAESMSETFDRKHAAEFSEP